MRPTAKMMSSYLLRPEAAKKDDSPPAATRPDPLTVVRGAVSDLARRRAELVATHDERPREAPPAAERLSSLLAGIRSGSPGAALPAMPELSSATIARRIELLDARKRGLERYAEAKAKGIDQLPEHVRKGGAPPRG